MQWPWPSYLEGLTDWRHYHKENRTIEEKKETPKLTDSKSWLTLKMSSVLMESDVLRSDWLPSISGNASSSVKASGAMACKKNPHDHNCQEKCFPFASALRWKYSFNNFYLSERLELYLGKWRTWSWRLHE